MLHILFDKKKKNVKAKSCENIIHRDMNLRRAWLVGGLVVGISSTHTITCNFLYIFFATPQ